MDDLSAYSVDIHSGFIINQKEKVDLPCYYDPWIYLKFNLENLMKENTLRKFVKMMPMLSIEYLIAKEQLYYSHCILAFVTSGFVWYTKSHDVPKVLPKGLSVPLRQISQKLGLMPILCHSDMVLFNTVINQTLDGSDKRSIEVKETLICNKNWRIFQRETAKVELCFGPIVEAVQMINKSIQCNDSVQMILAFKKITCSLKLMTESMKGFKDMDPDYFHTEMRPFLVGWSGDSFPYKEGLLYENEDGSTAAIECLGASAAQSPSFRVLDAMFQVNHSDRSQSFFDTMESYMLKGHRDYIRDIAKFVGLRNYVQQNKDNTLLIQEYNECLDAVSFFRTNHMAVVTKFILNPSKKLAKTEINSEFLQERGTGGQDLLTFLKEVRSNTVNKKINLD